MPYQLNDINYSQLIETMENDENVDPKKQAYLEISEEIEKELSDDDFTIQNLNEKNIPSYKEVNDIINSPDFKNMLYEEDYERIKKIVLDRYDQKNP